MVSPDRSSAEASAHRSASLVATSASRRDARLDVFRGLALVMIFINHLPGNFYDQFTNRNFGFSDAAEGFVLMSGMAAGIAYGGAFEKMSTWRAIMKAWGRAWALYTTHLVLSVMALGIFAGGALFFGLDEILTSINMERFYEDPTKGLFGLVTLGHQFGYVNILPMYAALLFATPVFILLGRRYPLWLWGASIMLWAVSAHFRVNIPAYPNSGGWFFSPFTWQVIFVTGILTGLALRRGERLVPFNWGLAIVCTGYLLMAAVWVQTDFKETGRAFLAILAQAGLPYWLTGFDSKRPISTAAAGP